MSVVALDRRYGLKEAVRGELIKISSLRSTYWTIAVALAGSFGVTVLATWNARHQPKYWYQGFDATNQSLAGMAIAVLCLGVFGALAATGEYSTGTMRSTLSAAPRRPLLLLAKSIAVGGVALVVGEVVTFGCFGVGDLVLRSGGAPVASLGQAAVLRAVVLSGVFLALLALMALGIGVIVRHTAGAISTYVAVAIIVPLLLSRAQSSLQRFTPVVMLANSVSAVVHQFEAISLTSSMVLMLVYSAAALGLATVMMVRRDA